MMSSRRTPQPGIPADALIGIVLDGGWNVEGRAPRLPEATGGHFSTCYLVTNVDPNSPLYGQKGFLKALDYSAAASGPDMTRTLENLTAAYNFERDLIDLCNEKKMRHVVKGVAHGEHRITGFGPILDRVSYLIFEAAQHDLRRALTLSTSIDLTWMFRTLHNTANGLRQLHAVKVFHQDVKPSNILEFGESRKVGDLGRAHRTGIAAPHDTYSIPGDHSYAPPELLYRYVHPDDEFRRRATDLYQLGSLLYFLFVRASATSSLLAALASDHRPDVYGGTYQQVLPELRQAFDLVVLEFEDALPAACASTALEVFKELADPDVLERGVPQARRQTLHRLNLERYVSKFDRLARRAENAVSRSLR